MKLPAPKTRRRSENLVPLINVVFLLLIFYMVTATLVRPDLFPVLPPTSKSKTDATSEQARILLTADGRLALDNRAIDRAALGPRIAARLAEKPKLRIVLKADARVPAKTLLAVMDLLRKAGLRKVVLTTVLGAP